MRARVWCALGDNCEITAPAWALFGGWQDGRQFVACVEHVKQFYPDMAGPPTMFTAPHDGPDTRQRQLGERE